MHLKVQYLVGKRKAILVFFLLVFTCFAFNTVYYIRNTVFKSVCLKQLPKALIIGAPRCGTAALSEFLSHHQDIAIDAKRELSFFSYNYDKGLDWYKENLPCSAPGQTVIERSSNYIRTEHGVVERVWSLNRKMKLILIVCEPVRRSISQYAMSLSHHTIKNVSFEETIFRNKKKVRPSYMVNNSNYSFSFAAWRRVFPLEQFHIVDGDNLKVRPWEEVQAIERFLGVRRSIRMKNFVYKATKGFFCFRDRRVSQKAQCLSPEKGRKHPEVSDRTKARLREYFEPCNMLFYKQCGRTFNW